MKKFLLCLVFSVTLIWGMSVFADSVKVYSDYPEIAQKDYDYSITVVQNGVEYPLNVYSLCRETGTQIRDDYRRFAEFEFDGEVEVKIKSNTFDLSKSQVIPSSIANKSTYADGVITVRLDENCNFAVNVGKDYRTTVGVFAYAPEADAPTENSENVIYYGPGYHEETDFVVVPENKTLYLAPGCVLNAQVKVMGNGASVKGRGILRDRTYNLTAGKTQYKIDFMLYINDNVSDVTIKDIKIADNKGYGIVGNKNNKNVLIDNVHLMSNKSNSDGVSFWGGATNLTVKNSFIFNGDNAFVFKGELKDVTFTDCIVGTSVAVVGFSREFISDNVVVKNISVFATNIVKSPNTSLVINNTYNAVYDSTKKYNVDGITIENIDATYCDYVPRLFSGNGVGEEAKNYTFKNIYLPPNAINGVNILSGGGYNMSFENVWIGSTLVDSDETLKFVDSGIGTSKMNYSYTDKSIKVFVNGYLVKFDSEPVMKNDRTLIPIRAVASAFGASVKWIDEENKAVIALDGKEIVIKADDATAYVNGEAHTLDVAATVINDRCYVPLRFIGESFDAKVDYIEKSNAVTIESDKFSIVVKETLPEKSELGTNLLGNGDIEEEKLTDGANYGWASCNDCLIKKVTSSDAQSGNNYLYITDRKFSYSGFFQEVINQLKANGPGKYKISGYFKTPGAGSELNGKQMVMSLGVMGTGDGKQRTESVFFDISDTWQYVEKECNIFWDGDLIVGRFIAAGTNKIVFDFCADNLKLEKVADYQEGEVEKLIAAEKEKQAAAQKEVNEKSQPQKNVEPSEPVNPNEPTNSNESSGNGQTSGNASDIKHVASDVNGIIVNSTCNSLDSFTQSGGKKPTVKLTVEEENGNKYLKLSGRTANYFGIEQILGSKAKMGVKYKIEFNARIVGDTSNSSAVDIFFLSSSNSEKKGYKRISGVGDKWNHFTAYYTLSFEADDLRIQFRPETSAIDGGNMSTYDLCIDDIVMVEE